MEEQRQRQEDEARRTQPNTIQEIPGSNTDIDFYTPANILHYVYSQFGLFLVLK